MEEGRINLLMNSFIEDLNKIECYNCGGRLKNLNKEENKPILEKKPWIL